MAEQESIGNLAAYLGADVSKLRQDLHLATKAMSDYANGVERKLDKANKTFEKHGTGVKNNLINFQCQAMSVAAGIGSVTFALKKAIDNFSIMDKGLIAVKKTTGLTTVEMADLEKRLRSFSTGSAVSTQGLLGIASAAGQLGVKGVDNIMLFTETLSKMEVASDVVGEEGAKSLARLLNTAGESISNVKTLGSVIVQLGNNMAASEAEIVHMAGEIGRSTAAFKFSSTSAVAYGAALKAMGARAESAGSAMSILLIEVQKALIKGGPVLKELERITGMTGKQFKEVFEKDAAEALQILLNKMSDLTVNGNENLIPMLERLGITGQEGIKGIAPLVGNIEELNRAVAMKNAEVKDAKALDKEAEEANKSFSSQMGMTMNAIFDITSSIGKGLTPAIVDLNKALRESKEEHADFFNTTMPNAIEKTIAALIKATKYYYDFLFIDPAQDLMTNMKAYGGMRAGTLGVGEYASNFLNDEKREDLVKRSEERRAMQAPLYLDKERLVSRIDAGFGGQSVDQISNAFEINKNIPAYEAPTPKINKTPPPSNVDAETMKQRLALERSFQNQKNVIGLEGQELALEQLKQSYEEQKIQAVENGASTVELEKWNQLMQHEIIKEFDQKKLEELSAYNAEQLEISLKDMEIAAQAKTEMMAELMSKKEGMMGLITPENTQLQIEAEMELYNERMQWLQELQEQKLVTDQEYNLLEEGMARLHQDKLYDIKKGGMERILSVQKTLLGRQVNDFVSAGVGMLAAAGQFNDKMFKIAQITGAAQAFVSTLVGAAEALKLGWPLGPIAAMKVMAQGLGLVAAIKGASSSGGGGSVVGAGGISATPVVDVGSTKESTFYIQGVNSDQLYTGSQLQELLKAIEEASEDGRTKIRIA